MAIIDSVERLTKSDTIGYIDNKTPIDKELYQMSSRNMAFYMRVLITYYNIPKIRMLI